MRQLERDFQGILPRCRFIEEELHAVHGEKRRSPGPVLVPMHDHRRLNGRRYGWTGPTDTFIPNQPPAPARLVGQIQSRTDRTSCVWQ